MKRFVYRAANVVDATVYSYMANTDQHIVILVSGISVAQKINGYYLFIYL